MNTENHQSRGVPSPGTPETLSLRGIIERVVSFNEETGQCLLDVKPLDRKDHLLVSALVPNAHPGQTFEGRVFSCQGFWQAQESSIQAPSSSRALKKFLKSGALPGLGPKLAADLAQAFPETLLTLLDEEPLKLAQVKGVGRKRQDLILSAWAEYKSLKNFEEFLFQEGLPLCWAKTLWPFHGAESLSFFKSNPYRAIADHDIPFDPVDAYAVKQGFALDSPERIRCALYDFMNENVRQGHCAFPERKLIEGLATKLSIAEGLVENALELELLHENLVVDTIEEVSVVYLKRIWDLEDRVSRKLLAFEGKEPPWSWFNQQKIVHWAQSLMDVRLAPLQVEAIETALSSSLTVITGGPGTGKTTLIRALVTILKTQFSNFALCSPTGRAAQRLEEATGAQARTIHRLLKYDGSTGGFVYNSRNPLPVDLVLVDEASMIDLELMAHLLEALPERCSLILVGDADQLPSVGAGNVLQSLIDSKRFSVVRLTDIFRQRDQSLIKINAHRINSGEMPVADERKNSDFHYIPVTSSADAKRTILDLVTRVIPDSYGIRDSRQLQILVPMNRGSLGTQQLNEDLQKHLVLEDNGHLGFRADDQGEKPEGVRNSRGQNFKAGDKVMVVKNDYKKDVFNGDIGFVTRIDPFDQFLEIQFEQRNVSFGFDELDRLTLAYAISVHKSQGSEYRAVVVVIAEEHAAMAQRHLIYTAVTRGKEQVFLVAHPATLQAAILSDEHNRRWQKLSERLSDSARAS